jgi:hypothetical protein
MIRPRSLPVAALISILVTTMPALATAHAELQSSSPAAGATLDLAPTAVTLTFDDELDPDASSFSVADADGHEVGSGAVDLTVPDRNVMTGEVTISEPGVYTVEYVAVSDDGHPVTGSFSFGYATDEPIPDPTNEEQPNTASSRPDLPVGAWAGILLLGLAGVLALRRCLPR